MDQKTKLYDKYIYKPGILMPVLAVVMFGCCTALFIYLSQLAETHPVDLMRLMVLQPPNGRYPFWILTLFSICFTVMGIAALYWRFFGSPDYLEITEYSIKIPRVLFKKEREIFFSDVINIEEFEVSGTKTIRLVTAKNSGAITNRLLESNAIYEIVRDSIHKQIP